MGALHYPRQEPPAWVYHTQADTGEHWGGRAYPYVYFHTSDGLWGAAHYGLTRPVGFVDRPEPDAAALNVDAGASSEGSYAVVLDARAPGSWPGWRAGVTLTAARDNRLGYYGLGNDTPYAPDSVTPSTPFFYRVSRSYESAVATIQRRVFGPLRALAGVTIERTDFRALPGASAFRRDVASDRVDSTTIPFTDEAVRAGLVLDTRDNELDPHAGVLVEGLFASGSRYTRTTAALRGYAHPLARLVVAGRLAGERMGGSPPLASELRMESSEGSFLALGGYHSLRGDYDARFVGPGKLLGDIEARYVLFSVPSLLEVIVVAFYDTGRVFGPGEAFRLTVTGLHQSGGGEVAIRFLRNSLLVVGGGSDGEGTQFLFGTQWSY